MWISSAWQPLITCFATSWLYHSENPLLSLFLNGLLTLRSSGWKRSVQLFGTTTWKILFSSNRVCSASPMWPLKTSKMTRAAWSGVLFLACTAWTCGRIMCRMNLCNYDAFSSCKHNRDNDRSACFLRTLIYACTSLSNSPSKEAYHESWQQSSSQSAVESAKITCMGMLNHWKRHIDHTGMSYVQLTDQRSSSLVDIWEQCAMWKVTIPWSHFMVMPTSASYVTFML